MRIELQEFLQKLGVNHVLAPYETMPWIYYDAEKGITCSAEVRMGPGSEDVEAEIQLLKDEDAEEGEDGKDSGEKSAAGADLPPGGRKQVLIMRAIPHAEKQWGPATLTINGKSYVNEFHDWEGKGCEFFRACIQSIQMGELPDIEDLIEKNMQDDSWGGGGRGKIGRKSPKIKPAQLLGMKK